MLVVFIVLVAFTPPPMRVSCLVHALASAPQPLAEPCDSVLLSAGSVSMSHTSLDMALVSLHLALAGLIWLIGRVFLDHLLPDALFNPISEPPPLRSTLT